jgi:hypothetical protein
MRRCIEIKLPRHFLCGFAVDFKTRHFYGLRVLKKHGCRVEQQTISIGGGLARCKAPLFIF